MRYVRDMGLNTIRLEGKPESEEFYDLADRHGHPGHDGLVLLRPLGGVEELGRRGPLGGRRSLRDQVLRLRNRPSVVAWFNGSDFAPPAGGGAALPATCCARSEWPKPIVSNASGGLVGRRRPGREDGGPYDYVPPSYWLADTASTAGPSASAPRATGGMAVPPIESLEQMMPRDRLWPMNEVWKFHAGGQEFADINLFTRALEAPLRQGHERAGLRAQGAGPGLRGPARHVRGLRAQQVHAPPASSSGCSTTPGPRSSGTCTTTSCGRPAAYFGTKTACRPLHVQYSYDDRSVVVVDDRHQASRGLKVTASVLTSTCARRFSARPGGRAGGRRGPRVRAPRGRRTCSPRIS